MSKSYTFCNTLRRIKLVILFVLISAVGICQKVVVSFPNAGFEASSLTPWAAIGNHAGISTTIVQAGRQAVVLSSGSGVQTTIQLKPKSKYRLTGWLKTASGSDEVRLTVRGLGTNNAGIASALSDWKEVRLDFVTGEGQSRAVIEITNPENIAGNQAWADDLKLEYAGVYKPGIIAGIRPLAKRVPKTDLGITQQPNSKMDWLLDAKFGMFIHWGLYAGPGKGEWYMENQGIRPEQYRKLAYPESGNQYFEADKFNADDWAELAQDAGMKYMCMVTMHHDGYALFNSKAPNAFTSKQTHNRDFVKEYTDACRRHGLKVGLYKTLINWRYPGYYDVTGTNCKPNNFGYTTDPSHKENAREMKDELYCQVKELMTNYGKIDLIFWDGGWLGQQGSDADGAYFWESGKFLNPANEWPVCPCFQDKDIETGKPLGLMGIVRKYQPDVIVNSRSGWYGDIKTEEGSQPITGPIRSGDVWEKCMAMAPAWGYTPAHDDSTKVISCGGVERMLADCVIRNMALLLNVGPDRHGQITRTEANVLRQTGRWLGKVGDAVYGTRGGPWNPKDGEYGFAYKNKTIYIFLLNDFKGKAFILPAVNRDQKVVRAYSVSEGNAISFRKKSNGETILNRFKRSDKDVTILAVELNKAVMP
jgi:alpha-L-fucosidase